MARTFVPISQDELQAKIRDSALPLMDDHTDRSLRGQVWTLIKNDAPFVNDFKVDVDFENFECLPGEGYNGCESITGPQTLENGLSFVGCVAGGDWQCPVFFIIYWDGKRLRAYVPTDGNTWNTDTKTAYGDDSKADFMNAKKRYPDSAGYLDGESEKSKKRWKELGLPDDYFEFDPHSDVPECDPAKIIADIETRIVLKTKKQLPEIQICDGFRITKSDQFITIQPTKEGDVKGRGFMLTYDMARDLVKKLMAELL